MTRIYKVLLPYYKKDEMEKEINSEWIFDCGGRADLDYNLIVQILFRVAMAFGPNRIAVENSLLGMNAA